MRRGLPALLIMLLIALLTSVTAAPAAAAAPAVPDLAALLALANTPLPSLLPSGASVTTGASGHTLTMRPDGDLTLHRADGMLLWHSDTAGQPGVRLEVGSDGELALRPAGGAPIWFAGTSGNPGAQAWLQTDGNLVVYAASGTPLWDSAGHLRRPSTWVGRVPGRLPPGAATLSPNGRNRLVAQTDGNVVLYEGSRVLWHLGTWGRPGAAPVVQGDGNVVLYSSSGAPLWFTGTNGLGPTRLHVQDDGNTVLYGASTALWDSAGWAPSRAVFMGSIRVSLRAGETIQGGPYRAVLQSSGDLVVSDVTGPVWSTRTAAGPRARLAVEGGNVLLRAVGGDWRWATATGDGAELAMQGDGNLVLYNAVGMPRWDRLAHLRRWPVVSRPPVVPTGNPLTAGWNGGRVKLVQQQVGLIRSGSGVTMDPTTVAAVAAWQRARGGLRTDGVVDRATWDAMVLGWPFDIDGWMPAVAVGPGATAAERSEQLARFALSQVGAAYTWGGAGPTQLGYDCSGLALAGLVSSGLDPWPMTVIAHQGPAYNTAAHFYADARYLAVPAAQMRRGDLVFYASASGTITHMAIYLGSGQVVEAAGSAVRVRSTSTPVGAAQLPSVKRPFG